MNDFFQQYKRLVFLVFIALALLAMMLFYFVVQPLLEDLNQREQAIVSQQEQLILLENSLKDLENKNENVDVEQLLAEKKIPAERELDNFINSLHQLEQITKSTIENITFTYDSQYEAFDENDEEGLDDGSHTDDGVEETKNDGDGGTSDDKEEITPHPVTLTEIPEGLEMITVNISAQFPSFDEVVKLVKAIENEERIMLVSRLTFDVPTETDIYFTEDDQNIPLSIDVSTFYYSE